MCAGEEADIWPAKGQRIADGLALAHGDICAHFAGRRDHAKAHHFGEDRDEQRFLGVRSFRDGGHICDRAEDVRGLADHAGRVAVYILGKLQFAIDGGGKLDDFNALSFAKCARCFGIVWVQAAREDDFFAPCCAARHDGGFGAGR